MAKGDVPFFTPAGEYFDWNAKVKFTKLHGLGNDFVVAQIADSRRFRESLGWHARKLCHRHCSVGADGVLYYQVEPTGSEADVITRIYNADGSEAEMSGNGVRCLAASLLRTGQCRPPSIKIQTVAGMRALTLRKQRGENYIFESSMGEAIISPDKIPLRLADATAPLIKYPLSVGSEVIQVTITSMGNPHCSTFWTELDDSPMERLGSAIEKHELFPSGTNVEFVQVLDRSRLRVRFWERGVGKTLASGTGSCAAAAAAMLRNLVDSPVTIETELGSLTVKKDSNGEMFLTGPAEFVFSGECPDPVAP